MNFLELLIISIGLSMDALAAAICKGLSLRTLKLKDSLKIGLYFGVFQGLMPLIGFFLGSSFKGKIEAIDHWIAFVLLLIIGLNMIREARSNKNTCMDNALDFRHMCILGIATSIDALAIGVTLAFLDVNIISSALTIGITTFIISSLGSYLGHGFGAKYKDKAEIAGGIILILMGTKILLSHLGIIAI